MNLYDQLLSLQILENAYKEWENYRQELTKYIIDCGKHGGSLALFGAGRCNDLDLKLLESHFSSIMLIDKDEKAMQHAIKQYQLEDSKVVKTRVIDFIGLTEAEYRAYADALVYEVRKLGRHTNCQQLAKFAINQLNHLYQKMIGRPVQLEDLLFDTSVVIGVHSQLISILEWIWSVILQTIGQNESSVRNRMIEMNSSMVSQFNTLILQKTRDRVIIGCEEGRIGQIGSIQGATQGLRDIERRIAYEEIKSLNCQYIKWPFNVQQGVVYHVKLQTLVKNT